MVSKTVSVALLVVVLAISFSCVYYSVNAWTALLNSHRAAFNDMRAGALLVYGEWANWLAHYIEKLNANWSLETCNYALWTITPLRETSHILPIGLERTTETEIYFSLHELAHFLGTGDFNGEPDFIFNITKVTIVTDALEQIADVCIRQYPGRGEDPLERYSQSEISSVINNCEIIEQVLKSYN